jgi:hypothetical protein
MEYLNLLCDARAFRAPVAALAAPRCPPPLRRACSAPCLPPRAAVARWPGSRTAVCTGQRGSAPQVNTASAPREVGGSCSSWAMPRRAAGPLLFNPSFRSQCISSVDGQAHLNRHRAACRRVPLPKLPCGTQWTASVA